MIFRNKVAGAWSGLIAALGFAQLLATAAPAALPLEYNQWQSIDAAELCFPQLASGGGYATRFLLVNTSDADIAGTLELFRSDGSPLPLAMNGTRNSSFPFVVNARGTVIFDSANDDRTLQTGWARVRSVGPIGGALLYSYRTGSRVNAEAGIDAAVPASRFQVPVDMRDGRQVGLAIANPNAATVTLGLAMYDAAGRNLARETRRLDGLHHFAQPLGELFPAQVLQNFLGTVAVEVSGGKVVGTCLRFDEAPGSLASLPVHATESNQKPYRQYLPQIADGGGFHTTLSISNGNAHAVSAVLELFKPDGTPLMLMLNGQARSRHSVSVPAGAILALRTPGTEPSVQVGWGRLTGDGELGSSILYAFSSGGQIISEAGMNPAPSSTDFRLPIDGRGGISCGLAAANPSENDRVSLNLSLFNVRGEQIGATMIRTLGPRSQFAMLLEELFPGRTWNDFTGSLQVKASGEGVAAAMMRFDTGVSVLSSLPVIPFKHADPVPWTGSIRIELGAEETVFDYRHDHCAAMDLPDVYAHAIRTPGGIVLGSGNAPDNYFMFGQDFSSLKRNCTPVLRSGDRKDVDAFDPQEWITSLYSEDGTTIHALVHNEYHDPYAANCRPGVTDPSNPCWYNYLSYAVSRDGGRTFTQPESPGHLVAMLPFQWKASAVPRGAPPPHGYFEPSNIVPHAGWYYSLFFAITSSNNAGRRGTCIMRTHDPGNPGSWQLWDGRGFNLPLVNPYPSEPADPESLHCAFVSPATIRDLRGSLTWNRHLGQFMLIGAGVFPVGSKETCGFFLSRSTDLLNWSAPQLIRETVLGGSPCARPTPDQAARNISQEAYPSLIDHQAPDISFTSAGESGYLYFMQNMDNHSPGGWGLRRNLVRLPVRFVKEQE